MLILTTALCFYFIKLRFSFSFSGTKQNSHAGYLACSCVDGFYRIDRFGQCYRCPSIGVICQNGTLLTSDGYFWRWKLKSHKESYRRFIQNIKDLSGNYDKVYNKLSVSIPFRHRCPREQSCIGGNLDTKCEEGYQGPLCAVCKPGYYALVSQCNRCPTMAFLLVQISLVAISAIFLILLVRKARKSSTNHERSIMNIFLARLKIIIGFYQVMSGTLSAFSYIKVSSVLKETIRYAEFLQLNILQIAPLQCYNVNWNIDSYTSLTFALALVVAVVVGGIIYHAIFYIPLTLKKSSKEAAETMSSVKQSCIQSVLLLLFVIYPETSGKIFRMLPLSCHSLCADPTEALCPAFLNTDYSVSCNTDKYNSFVKVAYTGLIFSIGFPAAVYFLLWKYHYKMVLKSSGSTEKDNATNAVSSGMSFIYENYSRQVWFWEVIELLRKLILTSVLVLIGTESRWYIGSSAIFAGLYAVFFALYKPIPDRFEYWLQLTSLLVTFVNLMVGLMLKIPDDAVIAVADKRMDAFITSFLLVGANLLVLAEVAGMAIIKVLLFRKTQAKLMCI